MSTAQQEAPFPDIPTAEVIPITPDFADIEQVSDDQCVNFLLARLTSATQRYSAEKLAVRVLHAIPSTQDIEEIIASHEELSNDTALRLRIGHITNAGIILDDDGYDQLVEHDPAFASMVQQLQAARKGPATPGAKQAVTRLMELRAGSGINTETTKDFESLTRHLLGVRS